MITLIHRQETVSFLGIPLMRHIDIDDAESVLQAIRDAQWARDRDRPPHPRRARARRPTDRVGLADHDGKITAVVPHYAMSGGTMIALAADEILVDAHAALGPIDPQVTQYPAASLIAVAERPGPHTDETLILADISRKAIHQVQVFAEQLLTSTWSRSKRARWRGSSRRASGHTTTR